MDARNKGGWVKAHNIQAKLSRRAAKLRPLHSNGVDLFCRDSVIAYAEILSQINPQIVVVRIWRPSFYKKAVYTVMLREDAGRRGWTVVWRRKDKSHVARQ